MNDEKVMPTEGRGGGGRVMERWHFETLLHSGKFERWKQYKELRNNKLELIFQSLESTNGFKKASE